jgi:hypothetical protein
MRESIQRRHALYEPEEALKQLKVGDRVIVTDDAGREHSATVRHEPWQLGHGAWVVGLTCDTHRFIGHGGYSLDRVRTLAPGGVDRPGARGELEPLPVNAGLRRGDPVILSRDARFAGDPDADEGEFVTEVAVNPWQLIDGTWAIGCYRVARHMSLELAKKSRLIFAYRLDHVRPVPAEGGAS